MKPNEKPILFSGGMVRAILDPTHPKTQTRRVVKPQPPGGTTSAGVISGGQSHGVWSWLSGDPTDAETWQILGTDFRCPYGVPGTRLWVRETHCFIADEWGLVPGVAYRASNIGDHGCPKWFCGETSMFEGQTVFNQHKPDIWRWRPSIFMHRWASRIGLGVTGIWVERVQEITTEAIIAEGLSTTLREHDAEVDLREQFRALWDSINAKRGYGWEVNPWVWVVDFNILASPGTSP